MKKFYLLICLILITSCWWESNVEITFEEPIENKKINTQKEIETIKVPEKNIAKINEAKSVTKNSSWWDGSSIKIMPIQENLKIEKNDWIINISNGTIIRKELPANFIKDFTDIFKYDTYSNSQAIWYAFSIYPDFDFKSIADSFIWTLESKSWKLEEVNLPETDYNTVRLHFTKQTGDVLEDFSIHFSNEIPQIFKEENIFKWKLIEFQYFNFNNPLNN